MNDERAPVELLRVDPRLLDLVASLFWATFPRRDLIRAGEDRDGRVVLAAAPPWDEPAAQRWQAALDTLLHQPRLTRDGAFAREVRDRAGRRWELALPAAPTAYAGGAWLVGPFDAEAAADRWAAERLAPPWVHDVVPHAGAWYADVFLGDPDG